MFLNLNPGSLSNSWCLGREKNSDVRGQQVKTSQERHKKSMAQKFKHTEGPHSGSSVKSRSTDRAADGSGEGVMQGVIQVA